MSQASSVGTPAETTHPKGEGHEASRLPVLVLGALGVVYGDIGTSPIYAFREALAARPLNSSLQSDVIGLLSLIVWALTATVTIKYVLFVTRADNKGEGGTLSLMTLARSAFTRAKTGWVVALGVIGASLFFGDAIITPAMSVLSAVEGLKLVQPSLEPWIIPITVVVLIILFFIQRFGTARVSIIFGPITALWFLTLGVTGFIHILEEPGVLIALNPAYGLLYLYTHATMAFTVIGVVFLAVTGAEGLYVDLGHFGRKPIVIAWIALVFPSLLLNYFGQGAFVLSHGMEALENPIYLMQPDWFLLPFVILATFATVIASQAVISGMYSLTQQAIALNMLPRMQVLHTSATQSGQIYVPYINAVLAILVLILVVGFGSSKALSSAYGIAVSGVMFVTSILLCVVIWRKWRWHPVATIMVMTPFLIIDTCFFGANILKMAQGGWVPAVAAGTVAIIMASWMAGRKRLAEKTRRDEVPLEFLVTNLTRKRPTIVPGTAVFLTSDIEGAPTALLHSLKHYKVLHEHNVILTVMTSASPRVPDEEKVRIEAYNELFSRVVVTFGYMEAPNIPKALGLARKLGWKFDIMSTSFFLSRRSLKPSPKRGIQFWQDKLFMALSHNASDATEYFHIPTGRVVEIGTQVMV